MVFAENLRIIFNNGAQEKDVCSSEQVIQSIIDGGLRFDSQLDNALAYVACPRKIVDVESGDTEPSVDPQEWYQLIHSIALDIYNYPVRYQGVKSVIIDYSSGTPSIRDNGKLAPRTYNQVPLSLDNGINRVISVDRDIVHYWREILVKCSEDAFEIIRTGTDKKELLTTRQQEVLTSKNSTQLNQESFTILLNQAIKEAVILRAHKANQQIA